MIRNSILLFMAVVLMAFAVFKIYNDGTYTGISRAGYTDEPYYGTATITIENGKLTTIKFFVRDTIRHEYMDNKYEKYFVGNDEYIKQCRNDWKGIQSYPDSLLKHQDLDKVDVISGATWSYNIFKASAQEALLSAEKEE